MIKSLKGKRNFAGAITEFPKSLLANRKKVPCEQKLLENTIKAITVFNTVILLTHTQKTVYRLCMRSL
jgi:hypothetical protein